MSMEVNDSKAVKHFDMKSITQCFEKSRRIMWTIEGVSTLPDYLEKEGPCFVINSFWIKLSISKTGNEFTVYLNNTDSKCCRVDTNLVLLDCEGTKLQERIKQNEVIDRLSPISIKGKLKFLKSDQLIIDCFLKMVDHVTKTIRSLKPPEEYQKKLLNDLKMICNNPDGSDFTLCVGGELIYTHKTILSLRSTYFKTMFETNMTEKEQNSVLITDVSYSTMKMLVEFLYTGTFSMAKENDFFQEIQNFYIAADKYQVIDLKCVCADKLLSHATAENILGILQLSINFNDERLKTETMSLMPFHFDKIIKSDAWKEFLLSDVRLATEITQFCFKKS